MQVIALCLLGYYHRLPVYEYNHSFLVPLSMFLHEPIILLFRICSGGYVLYRLAIAMYLCVYLYNIHSISTCTQCEYVFSMCSEFNNNLMCRFSMRILLLAVLYTYMYTLYVCIEYFLKIAKLGVGAHTKQRNALSSQY